MAHQTAAAPGLIKYLRTLEDVVSDFSREFVARTMEYCGREKQAHYLRTLRENKEVFPEAWGKPNEVRTFLKESMNLTGKMVISAYLSDLLLTPLRATRPFPDESFRQWSMRARVHEQADFVLEHMPFTIEEKWNMVTAQIQHAGFDLDSRTRCFVFRSKG